MSILAAVRLAADASSTRPIRITRYTTAESLGFRASEGPSSRYPVKIALGKIANDFLAEVEPVLGLLLHGFLLSDSYYDQLLEDLSPPFHPPRSLPPALRAHGKEVFSSLLHTITLRLLPLFVNEGSEERQAP